MSLRLKKLTVVPFTIISLFSFFSPLLVEAKAYDYKVLRMKDMEEMKAMVDKILNSEEKESSKKTSQPLSKEEEGKRIERLREALKLIFSRPDFDNMVSKLADPIRSELKGYNAYEDTMTSLSGEGIYTLVKSQRGTEQKISMIFLLENIMSEIKPEAPKKREFKKILETIRDAKIELDHKITTELRLKLMIRPVSPSATANQILESLKKE